MDCSERDSNSWLMTGDNDNVATVHILPHSVKNPVFRTDDTFWIMLAVVLGIAIGDYVWIRISDAEDTIENTFMLTMHWNSWYDKGRFDLLPAQYSIDRTFHLCM